MTDKDIKKLIKAKSTQVSERFYNQSQSWHYERTISYLGHKLKVDIRRNAYDQQSYGRVSRWDGTAWQTVVNVPIATCKCQAVSYITSEDKAKRHLFEADADSLLHEAISIVV